MSDELVVGIATFGRPDILKNIVNELANQSRQPDRIVICPASEKDLPEIGFDLPTTTVQIVQGGRGLTRQRNAILNAVDSANILVFFDDDFLASPHYLASCEALFYDRPDVVVATGWVVADGVHGPGLTFEEGRSQLERAPIRRRVISDTYGAYGCNMAFRMSPIRQYKFHFDENLPLYGWQEDIDFSRTLAPFGRIVHYSGMVGVHLGHKSGRTSGLRTGYSQIANAWYLIRKGSLSTKFAGSLAFRNLSSNILRSFAPEPWVDRRGRLLGNFLALLDILRGRSDPNRILKL